MIILDCCYSGKWIEIHEQKFVDYSVAFYCSSRSNQESADLPDQKGGVFTNNLLNMLKFRESD